METVTPEPCCWPQCRRPRHGQDDDAVPPLCTKHLIRCAAYTANVMGTMILDDNEERLQRAEVIRQHGLLAEPEQRESVVYYVRMGDHIKIGTTIDLTARLKAFCVDHIEDALLATEPGGHRLEHQRHREFTAERVYTNRELFNPSRRLLAHIETLKERDQAA